MKQSTRRIRKSFRDPVTEERSCVWVDKITYRYDELEKGPIIMEFLKDNDFTECPIIASIGI